MTTETLKEHLGKTYISYTAVPFPIPEPFRSELIAAAKSETKREQVTRQIKLNCGRKVRREFKVYPFVF